MAGPALADPPPPIGQASGRLQVAYRHGNANYYRSQGSTGTLSGTETFYDPNNPNPPSTVWSSAHSIGVGAPYVEADATNPQGSSDNASAHAELRYDYELTIAAGANPPPGSYQLGTQYVDMVTVSGISKIHTSGPNTNVSIMATSQTAFGQTGEVGQFHDGSSGGVYDADKSFSFSAPGTLVGSNVVNGIVYEVYRGTINMQADAYGVVTNGINPYSGTGGTAYLDPLVTINQPFLDMLGVSANDATLRLSPGVSNAIGGGAVPEPSAWAMMVVGFGAIGLARRVRHKTTISFT
ncbi:PEPxxWA-CTERM sorting domain-containing protein [Sphingomonas sp. MMS24-J13]|uniref:PEPxxWA-CTERM sorting domain-containing protein n=1 Tax=Sphingomonas sp. MMS24-J13 TaxID=3238686 RepID=UPI00384BDF37